MDLISVLFEPTPLNTTKSYSSPHHGLLIDRIWRMQTVLARPISANELARAIRWSVASVNSTMVQARKTYRASNFEIETQGNGANRTYLIRLTAPQNPADQYNPNKWMVEEKNNAKSSKSALENLIR